MFEGFDGRTNYISGSWEGEASGRTKVARSPIDGSELGEIAWSTRSTAAKAIAAARDAQSPWSAMSPWERTRQCRAIADALRQHSKGLARLLTTEQGKPIGQAEGEIEKGAQGFELAADLGPYLEGRTIPSEDPRKHIFTIYQPRGVYGVITPWNFPVNIPIEYLAPGIAVGNTVVWVPAPTTSLIAVALMRVFEDAGLPPGVINLLTGAGPEVGDELAVNPGVDAIGFTGSAETGATISARARGKAQIMELGGNGPVIVRSDANLGLAAEAAARGAFNNAGQICSASERILVHEDVHDAFAESMAEIARNVVLGNPLERATTMGPLNNDAVASKTEAHVSDALGKGATALTGGRRAPGMPTDLYFEPTVLTGVAVDSLIYQEETFGPVAPLLPFNDDEEAILLARNNRYGLTAAVFTNDLNAAFDYVRSLPTGLVNVNGPSSYWELHLPFGGASGSVSGASRIGGRTTLEAMSQVKTTVLHLG